MINLTGRGILTVKAQGQHSEFLFATVHLESPIGAKSPLRPFFEESRRVQAQQVGLTNPLVVGQMHQEACCGSAVQASGRRRLVVTCTCNAWFWTRFQYSWSGVNGAVCMSPADFARSKPCQIRSSKLGYVICRAGPFWSNTATVRS